MNINIIFAVLIRMSHMDKEILKTIIKEGQEDILAVELYERPFEFEENGRYVMVGVRHAGKSYMLYQRARQLLSEGHSINEMLYLNFDDERLFGTVKAENLDEILQAYSAMYTSKPILFLDEIQNIDGWEHFARRLANQKYQVYITGSNAKMLSRDIETVLGNRYIDADIYPYSFKEYLEAKGITLGANWVYGRQKNDVVYAFNEYFHWGGFPELLMYQNKRRWLNRLYEKILLGDIIQRNHIQNEAGVRLTVKRLAESVKQPISYNRIAHLIQSIGLRTTPVSVMDYAKFAKDACLIFSVDNFASKFVEKETVKKHYFVDNGLLNIFINDPETSLLENLCAIHLYKRYEDGLYFWNKNAEVDFYIPDINTGIQVCYSTTKDLNTFEREVSALESLDRVHPMEKMIVITFDEERAIELRSGKTIELIPAWKWLLTDGPAILE